MYNTFDHGDFAISETRIRREKWKEMLRSGHYTQETNYLHTGGLRYCSMGIGYEAYRQSALQGYWTKDNDKVDYYWFVGSYGNSPQALLSEVFEWYGLEELIRKLSVTLDDWDDENNNHFAARFFIYMNDTKGMSFKEIADVLDMMENPVMFKDELQKVYNEYINNKKGYSWILQNN